MSIDPRTHLRLSGAAGLAWILSAAGPFTAVAAGQDPFGSTPASTTEVVTGVGDLLEYSGADPNMTCLPTVHGNFDLPCEEEGGSSTCTASGCGSKPAEASVEPVRLIKSGTKSPIPIDRYFTFGQSAVDNLNYNFIHYADDYKKPDGATLYVRRYLRSRQYFVPSSLGPGLFASFDIRLTIDLNVPSGSNYVHYGDIFDAASTNDLPVNSMPAESALQTPHATRAKNLELLDSLKQPIDASQNNGSSGQVSGVKYARLNVWDGTTFLFELINTEVGPSHPNWGNPTHGRLIEAVTVQGHGYDINYQTWTNPQLDASPTRQWQIDTIVDKTGPTLTLEYNSQQQSGQWAVSRIVFPDGGDVNYTYAGGFLASATHEDGTTTTITYLSKPAGTSGGYSGNLVEIEIDDAVAAPKHRRKSVAVSGSTTVVNGTVVPTAVGLTRVIRNGAGEVSYYVAANATYEGGGKLRELLVDYQDFGPGAYYTDGWSLNWVAGEPVLTGTRETSEESFETLDINIWIGKIDAHVDETGVRREFDYDQYMNPIFIHYEDDTFEAFCYDADTQQVLRHRNRGGNVTQYVYDSVGRLLETRVGLTDGPSNTGPPDPYSGSGYNRCPTDDVQTSEYAVRTWSYHTSGNGLNKLATKTDELGNVTNYEYDSAGRLWKIIQPADTGGGTRAETLLTYDSSGRLKTHTDPLGHVTEFFYDSMGRNHKTTYADLSSQREVYGTTGDSAGLVVKTIDRGGVVTSLAYDAADRLITKKTATAVDDGAGNETATPETELVETYTYLDGTDSVYQHHRAGTLTSHKYDYRGRLVERTVRPRSGKTLVTKNTYVDNKLFSVEDPYGRKRFYAYDATDSRLIRTVSSAVPSYSLADYTAVLNALRDTSANADYVITDAIYEADGELADQFDGRHVKTSYAYDSRSRRVEELRAVGATVEAKTETVYDLASNVTEIRSPRYFDSGDTNGYQKAKQTWTYNGRNRVKTHVEAPGTTETATESFTYDLMGRQATHTDFAGKVWTNIYDSCCDKSMASKNPLGHGSIRNTNSRGLVVHTATVSDVDDHVLDMTSPVNAKTLGETTTRYDGRGRPVASTTWLVARGAVDVEDPPIAGLDSVSAADGLTTQYLYDDDLTDGVGLDSSGGVSVTKMATSGSHSVSLSAAITKLAAAQASGGAGISFGTGATGSASVVINPEDEISFTISDAAGRSVMRGRLDNYSGTAGNLLSWSTILHDTVTNVSGFGDCLETRSIDALGKATKRLVDGAGRTIQSIDQLAKVTAFTYDAAGNQLSVRDPNSVGQDVVYDELGRAGLTTDTASDTTGSTYDKAGNRLTAVDGKSNSTSYAYDARGRQKSQTDRLSGATSFTYLATGQLASLKDAENQTTSYTYDDAGRKLTETYPDHTGGSPGDSTYGIVTFTNDDAGRMLRKQDQNGDTVTYTYDLAGRLTQRDYRTRVNSPSGTIADSDTLTYDAASRMLTAVSGRYTNTVTFTYDTAGRKATEALTISGQTYTTTSGYNAKGQLTSYTYPDSTLVERTYTDRGQLYQLKHASTTIDTRTYDHSGRMTGSSYHNGVSESRTYNADNTLATISHTGATIGNLSYAWDDNKNKTGETITGTMSGYGFTIPTGGYDAEDRLVTYNRTDTNLDQSWNLSLVGDWNSITTEGVAQSRTHGPSHELLTGGGQNVSTDVKGNITLIPAALRSGTSALALNWDMDNRLSTADLGNDASIDVTYRFDALGRRVYRDDGTTAMVYVQSGQQTIADYVAGTAATSPTYRYVYASYIDEPVLRYKPVGTESLYYHRNQQYSVTALTDGTGAIVERYAYSAYGVPTIANASGTVLSSSAYDNRTTYTGREWDEELQLYHYRARMYDPELGRFCSRDPIRYKGSDWNLFEYVGSNPSLNIDAFGLRWGPVRPPVRPIRPGGPRGGPRVGPNGTPLPSPFPPPNPFPPGYPKPGINPAPGDPNYPDFVKRCWNEWRNSCRTKYPLIPDCKPGGKSFKETVDEFAEDNVDNGTWPSGARYEFVNCRKIQTFGEGHIPFMPVQDGPCGLGVPGYTIHCKVLVFTDTGIWLSERDAVSVIMCKCCDPNDPTAGPKVRPQKPHFPGGNRPPDHNIAPPPRPEIR